MVTLASRSRPATGSGPRGGALVLLLLATSCVTVDAGDGSAAARRLLLAGPDEWPDAMRAVLAEGDAPALADALQALPGAPGSQAALFTLGELGDRTAAEVLLAHLRRAPPLGPEAALSLGRIGAADAAPALRAAAADRTVAATTRAAAACALLDLGERREAQPMLCAVLVAGTPYAAEHGEHGLPDRQRWALERQMVIATLQRHCGTDFGLDPDAPWPVLRDGARRAAEHLASR